MSQAVRNVTRTGTSRETRAVKNNQCDVWNDLKERRALNHSAQVVRKSPLILVILCRQLMPFTFHVTKNSVSSARIGSVLMLSVSRNCQAFQILKPVINAFAGRGATQQDIERALSMGLTIE